MSASWLAEVLEPAHPNILLDPSHCGTYQWSCISTVIKIERK